jgi:hypothetical protein
MSFPPAAADPVSAADRDRFNVPREETWAKVKETLA